MLNLSKGMLIIMLIVSTIKILWRNTRFSYFGTMAGRFFDLKQTGFCGAYVQPYYNIRTGYTGGKLNYIVADK